MKKRNWQLTVLLCFLGGWVLFHLESIFFGVLTFLTTIPLNIHSFIGNVLGFENWATMLDFLNNPIVVIFFSIITFFILLKIVKLIDGIINQ